MVAIDWEQVATGEYQVPDHIPLAELTAELGVMIGDPDPTVRTDVALPVLTTWIERGVYDDLLAGLGDGLAAHLSAGLGRAGGDAVFGRSSAALVLAQCIARDTRRPLVLGGKVLEWGDRLATWWVRERDVRGLVPGKGWAHALAHGADALGVLADSPHVDAGELMVILDLLSEKATQFDNSVLTSGEPDRMAAAAMRVLRRNRVPLDLLETWVEPLGDAARLLDEAEARNRGLDRYAVRGNADAFLRALYLQLAFAPRPPEVRADLLLVLVEALRFANPEFLGKPAKRSS